MVNVDSNRDSISVGPHFRVSFQRTLRIPDDGREYPLPPGLGEFPICRVADYVEKAPASWRERSGFFIPMYQREALWLLFDVPDWRACAVKVAIGKVNALTGKRLHRGLNRSRQNYMVCPDQPWLDGINAGKGFIRQFIAMPLGMGYTVEGQLTGKEEFGGIQIMVYEPKPGKFPDKPPEVHYGRNEVYSSVCESGPGEMGLGAGGRMRQEIYPDEYGWDTWDQDNYGEVSVHIVNSMMYREITGHEPPPTPVSARTYTEYGFPWFDLYDEHRGDLRPAKALERVKSVKDMDHEKGFGAQQDDSTVIVPDAQVKKLKLEQP